MMSTEYAYDQKVSAIHRLRCNVKSLAAEAKFIRQETFRCGQAYKDALAAHRRGRLREESRYAQLALAFFRGRAYRDVEQICLTAPNAKRLTEKVKRYIWHTKDADIVAWLK